MASLSAVTSNDIDPQDDGDGLLYVPPRSSSFRTSMFPGFFTGKPLSSNPNPVSGSDPVAAPSIGEFGYTAPQEPAPEQQTSGLRSVTSNPVDATYGGTSSDERSANREKDIRDAGEVTDPMDAARAVALGLSLTSPTGIAGLAATTAANQLGAPDYLTDPVGSLLGSPNGNPWDLKSNTNRRPGFSEAYDTALSSAHKQGLTGSQAGQYSLDSAKAAGDIAASAEPFGVHNGLGQTPAGPSVTDLNRQTGFGAQGTNATPKGPGDVVSGKPTVDLNGPGAVDAPPAPDPNGSGRTSSTAPTNPGGIAKSSVLAPGGAPRPGGGGAGASGANGGNGTGGAGSYGGGQRGPGSRGGYNQGGTAVQTQKLDPNMLNKLIENHKVMTALAKRTGMSLPALVEKSLKQDGELGRRARIHKAMMDVVHDQAQRKATGGVMTTEDLGPDPTATMQYNPPAEMTEGDTDMVDASLTPGELVVTKRAAEQYRPEVKAAINDPPESRPDQRPDRGLPRRRIRKHGR